MMWTLDKHTLATISLIGSSFDVLGALYLAYDLLGGEHGPLRTLTRFVTYSVLFGTGYAIALGPIFGIVSGLAHGLTLAWEYSRVSRHEPKPGPAVDAGMSAVRATGFGLGLAYLYGPTFGIVFGLISAASQSIAYRIGIRPDLDYKPAKRPRASRLHLLAALNRTVGYAATGYVSSLIAGQRDHAVAIGLRTGLAIGLVTTVTSFCTPIIEWAADHVPERRMGVFGIALILLGFTLQSVQYWLVLLNVNVT